MKKNILASVLLVIAMGVCASIMSYDFGHNTQMSTVVPHPKSNRPKPQMFVPAKAEKLAPWDGNYTGSVKSVKFADKPADSVGK